jgi:hypothetical protein
MVDEFASTINIGSPWEREVAAGARCFQGGDDTSEGSVELMHTHASLEDLTGRIFHRRRYALV